MLFNKANLKILQDLDDRGTTSRRTTKIDGKLSYRDKLSPKNTSNAPVRNNGDLWETSCKKCEEADVLQREIIKLRGEKFPLLMKLRTKSQELRKVNKEKNVQAEKLLRTEKVVDNLQKEIEILRNKLNKPRDRPDNWKNLAKTANARVRESQLKIQNLEQSLTKEKMVVRVLQEHIERHICKEGMSSRNDSKNYDFLKKHTALQKLFRDKVNELNEKELQIHEKDKMLETLKDSKVRVSIKEHLSKSVEMSKIIKEKDREIRILIAHVNMCESAIAGYKNEVNRLKHILAEQTLALKQK